MNYGEWAKEYKSQLKNLETLLCRLEEEKKKTSEAYALHQINGRICCVKSLIREHKLTIKFLEDRARKYDDK